MTATGVPTGGTSVTSVRHARGRATGSGAGHRPRSRVSLTALWAVAALVVGLAVGNLVSSRPATRSRAPATPARTPADAVATLEQAVARNPSDVNSLQALGVAYVRQAVQTANPSFYDLAEKALDGADASQPDVDNTLIGRGVLALSRHQFAEALTFGERVHARNPDSPTALTVLVDAQVELGHYAAAAASLQDVLDRRPGLTALARVSYLRELHGDTPGAVEAMRQAEAAGAGQPFDVATVATFLGDLEFNQGHIQTAATAYRRALRLQPDLVLAQLGEARVDAARGATRRAIVSLERLTRRIPLPAAVTLLGDLQELDGRVADASRSFELVRTIGKLQQASGQVTDLEMALFEADHATNAAAAAPAVDLARKAYTARPDSIYTADAMAWALFRAGDPAGAVPYVNRALRLGTEDALLHYHAAMIADANGNDARARTELQAALARNPYFSFRYRADSAALATRLGIALPPDWARR